MGYVLVTGYLIGIGLYGFLYYLIDNLITDMLTYSYGGMTEVTLLMIWHATPLIVIVGGAIWLLMNMQKREVVY